MKMKTIGILGGMGPLATVDIFNKIVANTFANKDQEHIPIIIDNNTKIKDRSAYILGVGESPVSELQISANRLESAGAEAIIMPCNTAHYFLKEIEEVINIPIIKITETATDAIKARYPNAKRIAVISTTGTKVGKVYDTVLEARGYEVVEFSETLFNDIMECIYSGVKSGRTAEYLPLFQTCLDEIANLNADVIIEACTEIPMLAEGTKSNIPMIDATLELALATIKFAKG